MTIKKHRLLLGAHMSIAGGLEKAIERGASIGCTTIQLFTKSNRQWYAKPLTDQDIESFNKAKNNYFIDPIIAHAAYLINIAATDKDIFKKSISSLSQELERCEQLQIPYLVLHPGVHKHEKEGIKQIAMALDFVLSQAQYKTMILLETIAGQGSGIGKRFEQLADILAQVHHKKNIGICLDTCHIFAAGYELRTPEEYDRTWKEFDSTIGFKYLKVIHINDSKKELGSRIDRHENIGAGKIGLAGFSLLFNDSKLLNIPKILETPKLSLSEDLKNMKIITELINKSLKKELIISVPE